MDHGRLISSDNFFKLALVLISSIYLFLSCRFLPLPGLQYDEVLFANASLGNLDNTFIAYEWKFRHISIPVMVMPYIGAVKALMYTPILKLFPPSPITVRLPMIIVGWITLMISYALLVRLFDRGTALLILTLLATDPSYIFHIRLDWGPVSLMMFFKMASLFCLTQFAATRRHLFLTLGFLLLGVGVFDKVSFLWYVIALPAAGFLVWRRSLLQFATTRNVVTAACFFLLGCWPLVVYNVGKRGESFEGQLVLPNDFYATTLYRTGLLIETLNGSGVYRFVNGESPEPLTESLFQDPFTKTLTAWTLLVGLGLAAVNFINKGARLGTSVLSFLIYLFLFILAQIAFSYRATGWHHFMVAYPFPQVIIGVLLVSLIRKRSQLKEPVRPRKATTSILSIAALVVAVALVASNLIVDAKYLRSFASFGGRGIFSDAIYDLANYAEQNADKTFVLMDWGFNNQLLLLSNGSIKKQEMFWSLLDNREENKMVERLHDRALDRKTLFVFRGPHQTIYKEPRRLYEKMLQKYSMRSEPVRTFYQRDNEAVYVLETASPIDHG
jgi:hypothetical protein